MPKYKWQATRGSPTKRLDRLNHQREQMLSQASAEGIHYRCKESTRQEWQALLEERDRLVHSIVEQDNQKLLEKHMIDLYGILKVIGRFDHTHTPHMLKLALCCVHSELKSYLTQKCVDTDKVECPGTGSNLHLSYTDKLVTLSPSPLTVKNGHQTPCEKKRPNSSGGLSIERILAEKRNQFVDSIEQKSSLVGSLSSMEHSSVKPRSALRSGQGSGRLNPYPRRRVQFTPTESPLAAKTGSAGTLTKQRTSTPIPGSNNCYRGTPTGIKNKVLSNVHQNFTSTPKSSVQTPRSSKLHSSILKGKTPLDIDSEETLRVSLLKGKENLKSIPGIKRSPGGTPFKEAKPLDLNDAGDFVAFALRKKFFSIRRLYGSPSTEDVVSREEDFNLSID